MTTHSLDDPEDDFAGTTPDHAASGDAAKVPPGPRARPGVWRFAAELPVGQYAIPTESTSPEQAAGAASDYAAPGTESFADPNSAIAIDYDAPLKLAADELEQASSANASIVDGDGLTKAAAAPLEPDGMLIPLSPAEKSEFEFAPRSDLLRSQTAGAPFTEEDSWFDLWGFRALVWGLGTGAIALLVAVGMWLSGPKQDEGLLAAPSVKSQVAAVRKAAPVVVEKPEAAAAVMPPPAVAMPAPVIVAVPAPVIPPIITPAPESVAPKIVEEKPKVEQAEALQVKPRTAARRQPKAAPSVEPKPTRLARRTTRKVAPVGPVASAVASRPTAREARTPRTVKALTGTPLTAQAMLLKECRAYGYHAERCVQRGCVLTKFGLACKGK